MNKRIQLQKIEVLAGELIQPKPKSLSISYFTFQGKNVYVIKYDSVPTTMILSQKWDRQLVTDQNIFVFQAQEQTNGRGQNTNNWSSPPGNLYITILCRVLSQACSKLSIITGAAMVLACRKQLNNSHQVGIKWMNDIFLQDKKVGGCIVLTQFYQSKFTSQIGVGINLNQAPLLDSICLKQVKKENINISSFTRNFLQIFIESRQKPGSSFVLYRQSLKFIQQSVNIFDNNLKNVMYSGIFKGITEFGHAIIEIENNQQTLSQGRMRLKQIHPKKLFLFEGVYQSVDGQIIQIHSINSNSCSFNGSYRTGAKMLISQENIEIKGIYHILGTVILLSWSVIGVENNSSILSWTGVYLESVNQTQSGIHCKFYKNQINSTKIDFMVQVPSPFKSQFFKKTIIL